MKQPRTSGKPVPAWRVFPELRPPEPSVPSAGRVFAAARRLLPHIDRPIQVNAVIAAGASGAGRAEAAAEQAVAQPGAQPVAQTGAQPVVAEAAGSAVAPRSEIDLAPGAIRTTILSFRNMNEHGDLLVRYLRARHAVFIARLGWDLPETDGMEFDQYDTPICRWAVLHVAGEVVAGVRLTPTTAQIGMHSYMLRDAQLGQLSSIPSDVLFMDAPVSDHIWEASRLFITETVSAEQRAEVQRKLMSAMAEVALAEGASQVIGIVPYVFARWLRRLGLGAVPVGPAFSIDGTRSQAALFTVSHYSNQAT